MTHALHMKGTLEDGQRKEKSSKQAITIVYAIESINI